MSLRLIKLKYKALESLQSRYDIAACPYIQNQTGYTKHMYVKEHPLRGVGSTSRRPAWLMKYHGVLNAINLSGKTGLLPSGA